MESEYHQLSAFAAADGSKHSAYAIYDNVELVVRRAATIQNASYHRAILMAVWSIVAFATRHELYNFDLSVYMSDSRISDELTEAWYGLDSNSTEEDMDIINNILKEICRVRSVAFGVCKSSDTGAGAAYAKRMKELEEAL